MTENSTIPNKSGVYKITNTATGQIYVGSANNLRTRKNYHFHKLQNDRHVNKYLQADFNKYGEDSFEFEIIEFCEKEEHLEREQYYIDELNPTYNIAPTAGNMTGYAHDDATKRKISLSMMKPKTKKITPIVMNRAKPFDKRSMRNL